MGLAFVWNAIIGSIPILCQVNLQRIGIPEDAYFCSGHAGQRAVIIPSRNLVIVRLGMTHRELGVEWDEGKFLGNLPEYILEQITAMPEKSVPSKTKG